MCIRVLSTIVISVAMAYVASGFDAGNRRLPTADTEPPRNTATTGVQDSDADWTSVGRSHDERRHSPLSAINDKNVDQLGLAWFINLPVQGSLQATPLAVDGVLYFSAANGQAFAVNARVGQILWQYDPDLPHHAPDNNSVLFGSNRGLAYWKGKVFVGTVDGRLVALDGRTGATVWSVQTFDDTDTRKIISGAPRVFNGEVVIGHGGEGGTRGYVSAYDAESGRRLWRFYTVPGDPGKGFENPAMAMAAKTWNGHWWKSGGNGTVWDSMTYDPDLNRLYLGTANGTPVNADVRSPGAGDNLFVASIVALDADTGKYVWHYQVVPRDSFEYDATQQMVLTELLIGGRPHKVLMQASKNGFFYVIDRVTGKLISAQKYVKVTWAERVDLQSGRPVEISSIRHERVPIVVWPSAFGGHNWQSMSFSPDTGLAYIPTMMLGMDMGPGAEILDFAVHEPGDGTGSLLAWDPVSQTKRWEVRYDDSFWNGGTLSTSGNLVFQGTGRGAFYAYNAATGRKLWSYYAGLGINAAPMTYEVDGVQYVSILVGYGGTANASKVCDYGWRFGEQPRRLLTFGLGKHEFLPLGKPPRFTVSPVDDLSIVVDTKAARKGNELYNRLCWGCHGENLGNFASYAPDLRESQLALSWPAFESVVHEGSLAAAGMPRFAQLTESEMRGIYMYIRREAREAFRSAQ